MAVPKAKLGLALLKSLSLSLSPPPSLIGRVSNTRAFSKASKQLEAARGGRFSNWCLSGERAGRWAPRTAARPSHGSRVQGGGRGAAWRRSACAPCSCRRGAGTVRNREIGTDAQEDPLYYQTQVSLQGTGSEPLGLGPSSSVENKNSLACLPGYQREKCSFVYLCGVVSFDSHCSQPRASESPRTKMQTRIRTKIKRTRTAGCVSCRITSSALLTKCRP